MTEKQHSGISMHKLTFGAGFPGLLFTVGCMLIFVLGLPALWYFVVFSAGLGLGIAFLFHFINKSRSERSDPLSILQTTDETTAAPQRRGETKLLQPRPSLCTS